MSLDGPVPPLSKNRLRMWLKLLKSSRRIEDEIRRRFRGDHDSTLPRFDVMAALDRHPEGLKMTEISSLLRVSNGNVTGIVGKLVDEGLARRALEPGDRRAARVTLTQEGAAAFADLAAAHERWIDGLLAGLGADDIDGMIRRLDRLNATLEQERD